MGKTELPFLVKIFLTQLDDPNILRYYIKELWKDNFDMNLLLCLFILFTLLSGVNILEF